MGDLQCHFCSEAGHDRVCSCEVLKEAVHWNCLSLWDFGSIWDGSWIPKSLGRRRHHLHQLLFYLVSQALAWWQWAVTGLHCTDDYIDFFFFFFWRLQDTKAKAVPLKYSAVCILSNTLTLAKKCPSQVCVSVATQAFAGSAHPHQEYKVQFATSCFFQQQSSITSRHSLSRTDGLCYSQTLWYKHQSLCCYVILNSIIFADVWFANTIIQTPYYKHHNICWSVKKSYFLLGDALGVCSHSCLQVHSLLADFHTSVCHQALATMCLF